MILAAYRPSRVEYLQHALLSIDLDLLEVVAS
jgi:hypothetical protein